MLLGEKSSESIFYIRCAVIQNRILSAKLTRIAHQVSRERDLNK